MTMTNDPEFLDELVTRYLDGEATETEIARVEATPALVARAEQLQTVITLVASPITVPTTELDHIRATALAESAPASVMPDLDARRAKKLHNRNRLLAAAAVFVFLAVGFAAVQSGVSNNTNDTAAEAGIDTASTDGTPEAESTMLSEVNEASNGDSGDDDGNDIDDMATQPGSDMAAPMDDDKEMVDDTAFTEALPALDVLPDDLGEVANLLELIDRLSALKDAAETEARFAHPSPDPFVGLCGPARELLLELVPSGVLAVERAPVDISGLPQQVLVATGVDGEVVAVLIGDEACGILEVLDITGIDGG
ncbi:MAG: hypothetical protein P8I99_09345 [Acidimicrobiales bacterium]|nr:hypothetical protein [Acidimicrobiales bacterium]MDG1877602.1 hypothetical protein [Acidimicrobiales bacterium]